MQLNTSHPLHANLISLIGVDETNTLVDLVTPSRTFTLASGTSFGTGQWGRHFATNPSAGAATFSGAISDTDINTGNITAVTVLMVFHSYSGTWMASSGGYLVGPDSREDTQLRATGFAWDNTAARMALYGYSSADGGVYTVPFSSLTSGALATPSMLVGTTDTVGNVSKTYLNGVLEGTGARVSNAVGNAVHRRFFGYPGWATNQGKLVWYAMFNKALTGQEVADLYASLGADNAFALVGASAPDTLAPTLTTPGYTALSSTTVTGTVSTNENRGTLYCLASPSATATVAAVKAGSSKAVTAAGAQNINLTGLTASTSYYLHFVHTDAAGNDSAVSTTSQFTTTAVATKTLRINETLYVDSAKTATYAGNVAVTVLSRAATRAIVHQANSVAITAGVLPGITGASFATTGEAFDVVLVASDTVRGVYPATVTEG
jgi:hypothetical protein